MREGISSGEGTKLRGILEEAKEVLGRVGDQYAAFLTDQPVEAMCYLYMRRP